jgi:hypothetical protein
MLYYVIFSKWVSSGPLKFLMYWKIRICIDLYFFQLCCILSKIVGLFPIVVKYCIICDLLKKVGSGPLKFMIRISINLSISVKYFQYSPLFSGGLFYALWAGLT